MSVAWNDPQSKWWTPLLVGMTAALLITAATVQAEEPEWTEFGVAAVDITPDYPIRLNGFGFRREESEGVTQPIWAKALAIGSDNEKPALLYTVDSLGIRLDQVNEVARRLKDRAGIERDRIALTFTHSHCTPKVNGACDHIFSQRIPPEHQAHIDRYTDELTDKLVEVGLAALADRKPHRLTWAVGTVEFAKNRRTPGGPVDHSLPVLVAYDQDDTLRAVYATYACHCVTLSHNKVNGDWAGYAQEMLQRKFPDCVALISIGCGSDSNPLSGVTGDKLDVARSQGAQIADEVARLLEKPDAWQPVTGPLKTTLETIDLPLQPLPTREQWEALAKDERAAGFNARMMLERLDRGEKLPTKVDYAVQTWRFGDQLAMVFLAGEVCVDYALRLRKELVADRLWLHGYSNDFCCYIPSERLLKEGGYGGGSEIPYFALPTALAPGMEQRIIDEVKRQLPADFKPKANDDDAAQDDPAGSDTDDVAGRGRVPPKSVEQALTTFVLDEGLRIEPVASEPLIADPVAIDFGPDGRLWVVEMADYARPVDAEFSPSGRLKVLTDRDQDGRFDQAELFADQFRFPTEVHVWRDGVLVCDAPHVYFLRDTDGDGRSDHREIVLTGFATHNPHARVNSLRIGLDGWLYGSGGLFGGDVISAPRGSHEAQLPNRDFRVHPDFRQVEGATGRTQQGRVRDDFGNWFGCTNGALIKHYPWPAEAMEANPWVAPPPVEFRVPADEAANRIEPPGEIVLFKLSGTPGRPTSACGLEIYRDRALGDEFYGDSFTCEPVHQAVHRLHLERRGLRFVGTRPAAEAKREFLASTDQWFRPVQARTGPDGALWIVDMYRYVIEHPRWIPPETLEELNVMAGRGRGRIYRIVQQGAKNEDSSPQSWQRLADQAPAHWARAFELDNGVLRDQAHELLLGHWDQLADDQQATVCGILAAIVASHPRAACRAHALAVLVDLADQARRDATSELVQHAETAVVKSLSDGDAEVRRQGIRGATRLASSSSEPRRLATVVVSRLDDPAYPVRVEVALALGRLPLKPAEFADHWLRLAGMPAEDEYLAAALAQSLASDHLPTLARTCLDDSLARFAQLSDPLQRDLLATVAGLGDASLVAQVLESLAQALRQPDRKALASARLYDFLKGLSRRNEEETLVTTTAALRGDLWQQSYEQAIDSRTEDSARQAAIRMLGALARFESKRVDSLEALLHPRHAPAIQTAAVAAIADADPEQVAERLLEKWPGATPALRSAIVQQAVARPAWHKPLLERLESSAIAISSVAPEQRKELVEALDESLRERGNRLLAPDVAAAPTGEVLQRFLPQVTERQGDLSRGHALFKKHCAACHQYDDPDSASEAAKIGHAVGPDLAALTTRDTKSLLTAILEPSRDVDARYRNYIALDQDGRSYSGVLVAETAASVTLIEKEGKQRVLLRTEIDALRDSRKSLMPDGLEKEMDAQALADLIAFVQQLGGKAAR